MKLGYLRVSTEDQVFARQRESLKSVCDKLYTETISATNKKRPVFEKVLRKLKAGDTLVVHDLDRAFRSTMDALSYADKLQQRGVHFQVLSINLDTATPYGRFVYTVMAAQAQLEREILSERTKQGMAAAKRCGKHIGRVKDDVLRAAHAAIISDAETIATIAAKTGCSEFALRNGFERLGLR